MRTIHDFHKQFTGLFGDGTEDEGSEDGGDRQTPDGFQKRYGWINNAKEVADYERISLYECFEKDTMSFLNMLSLLKAKGEKEKADMKKYEHSV